MMDPVPSILGETGGDDIGAKPREEELPVQGGPQSCVQFLIHSRDSFGEDWSQFVEEEEDEACQSIFENNNNNNHGNSLPSVGVSTTTPTSRGKSNETMTASSEQPGAIPANANNNNNNNNSHNIVIELPPSLHPAVSEGMKRISSCYYSIHSTSTNNSGGDNGGTGGGGGGLNHHSSSSANGSLVDILAFLDCRSNGDEGSLGSVSLQRRASCSSLNSNLDMLSDQQQQQWSCEELAEDLLYHDILMTVFTYLDLDSLTSFSETALRPNFEVFYYLQLQLQQALLLTPPASSSSNDHGGLSRIGGTSRLTRLARWEYKTAEQIVQGYLDSNTTLRQMPLSHSLEYIRQVLMRQRMLLLSNLNHTSSSTTQQQQQQQQLTGTTAPSGGVGQDTSLFSGAALLIALIGAASFMHSSDTMMMNVDSFMPPAAELPNMLFRVGFVGSLMSAARSFASTRATMDTTSPQDLNNNNNNNDVGSGGGRGDMKQRAAVMKQQAEQFANNMMNAFMLLLAANHKNLRENGSGGGGGGETTTTRRHGSSMTLSVRTMMIRMMRAAYATAYGNQYALENGYFNAKKTQAQQRRQRLNLFSPNPYDHLPETVKEEEDENDLNDNPALPTKQAVDDPEGFEKDDIKTTTAEATTSPEKLLDNSRTNDTEPTSAKLLSESSETEQQPIRKTPTGCVGAYRRAISQVNKRLIELVKDERLRKYKDLGDEEQRRLGTTLLDACASDEGLENVKNIVEGGIDVEDFYVASDGTETSPLHAAAYHGACAVLEYLCQGLQDDNDTGNDDTGGQAPGPEGIETYNDGGLCQVNLKDPNGWTALHFASGTNSTECIRILARFGADLSIEAANGYTPLQWAVRLQNTEAADELRQLLAEQQQQQQQGRRRRNKKNNYRNMNGALDLSRLLFDHRGIS